MPQALKVFLKRYVPLCLAIIIFIYCCNFSPNQDDVGKRIIDIPEMVLALSGLVVSFIAIIYFAIQIFKPLAQRFFESFIGPIIIKAIDSLQKLPTRYKILIIIALFIALSIICFNDPSFRLVIKSVGFVILITCILFDISTP